MFGTYRTALGVPGALAFTSAGFIARLPIAITGLAIVLLVSTTTGSYALAGATSASFALAAALGGILTSRITDRVGQRRMLPGLVSIEALFLIAFVISVMTGQAAALSLVLVAIAGLAQPAIGSFVRARWVYVSPDSKVLQAGFAWESILDELIFTLGPLIAATLAVSVALPLPLIVAAILVVGGGFFLATLRHSEPPIHRASHAEPARNVLSSRGMWAPLLGALGLGGLFGSFDVATVAFTEQQGNAGAAGIVLALWALGSLVGGLFYGSRSWNASLPTQWLVSTSVLVVVVFPAMFVPTVPVLALAAFISGSAVAPSLIGVFSLTERLVDPRRLTEGLTWTNSGLALGFAAGSSLGGVLIDAYGTRWAFALASLATALACAAAGLGRAVLTSAIHQPSEEPPVPWNEEMVSGISAPLPVVNEHLDGRE